MQARAASAAVVLLFAVALSSVSRLSTAQDPVDCSFAGVDGDCSAVNREPCTDIANTCGPCKQGYQTESGSSGPGNSQCLLVDSPRPPTLEIKQNDLHIVSGEGGKIKLVFDDKEVDLEDFVTNAGANPELETLVETLSNTLVQTRNDVDQNNQIATKAASDLTSAQQDLSSQISDVEEALAEAISDAVRPLETQTADLSTTLQRMTDCQKQFKFYDEDTDACKSPPTSFVPIVQDDDADCTSSNEGAFRYSKSVGIMYYCDNSVWIPTWLPPPGISFANPGDSCAQIKQTSTESRKYFVRIGTQSIEVYCDMSGDGESLGGDGTTAVTAAASCKSIFDHFDSQIEGAYFLYPDGKEHTPGEGAQRAYCDGATFVSWNGQSEEYPAKDCSYVKLLSPEYRAGDYYVLKSDKATMVHCDVSAVDQGGDGSEDSPGITCNHLRIYHDDTSSGTRWIAPGGLDKFKVFCDQSSFGGGWTYVSHIGSAGARKDGRDGKVFPAPGLNADQLASNTVTGTSNWASVSRAQFNAIFAASPNAILRVYVSRVWDGGNPMTYFIKRLNPPNNWDAFRAVRYVPLWGSAGSNYRISRNAYDAANHDIPHQGGSMQHWEDHTTHDPNNAVIVSRHGITGDTFGGCEWVFNFEPNQDPGCGSYSNCMCNGVFTRLYIK